VLIGTDARLVVGKEEVQEYIFLIQKYNKIR